MEKNLETLDVIHEVHASVANANTYLTTCPVDRFNRTVLKLINDEIACAKQAASHWKYLAPDSHMYTHTASFPMAIFNELSEDFLTQLENSTDVSICADRNNQAIIKIILHF